MRSTDLRQIAINSSHFNGQCLLVERWGEEGVEYCIGGREGMRGEKRKFGLLNLIYVIFFWNITGT